MRFSGGRSRRTGLTLFLTALAAGPAAGALAAEAGPERPPVKEYSVAIAKTASKQSVQAKQGSYCLPAADGKGGTCRTVRSPQPDLPTITVRKGEQITLLFKVPVGYVTWKTARVNSKNGIAVPVTGGEGEQVTRTKKRWRVTLPKNLRKSHTVLGLFVQYANAYNSFEVGLKLR